MNPLENKDLVAALREKLARAADRKQRLKRKLKKIIPVVAGVLVLIIGGWKYFEIQNRLNRLESKVTFLKGEVMVVMNGAAARPAVLGETVPEGAVLRTAGNSEVDVGFFGGGGVKLDGATEVSFQRLFGRKGKDHRELEIDLRKGRIFHKVSPLKGESFYKVMGASTQILVRGTEFFVEIGENTGLVATRDGTVDVATVSVGAGQMTGIAGGVVGAVEPVGVREKRLFAQLDRIHELDGDGKIAPLAGITNTVGMSLVPLVINGGATDGEVVMFAAHETRSRDFAAFMADTGRRYEMAGEDAEEWRTHVYRGLPVGRGADETAEESAHPVIKVSWEDAQAFCVWLSEKEGRKYRLPTDHEWSCAVGLDGKENASETPQAKNLEITDAFPWGGKFNAASIIGNYSDQTAKDAFGPTWDGIPGYTDGFATTAPVGSFAPNEHGIYDLGGNVWEWCEDSYTENKYGMKTLRGGSWFIFHKEGALSSYRIYGAENYRWNYIGFRVVEVVLEEEAAQAVSQVAKPVPAKPNVPSKIILPNSTGGVAEWNYTIEPPGEDWVSAGFVVGGWKKGKMPFGAFKEVPDLNTVWDTGQIWLRTEFTVNETLESLLLSVNHNDTAEVYLNGAEIYKADSWSSGRFKNVVLTEAQRKSLRKGTNVICVTSKRIFAGQIIDLGLRTLSSRELEILEKSGSSPAGGEGTFLREVARRRGVDILPAR